MVRLSMVRLVDGALWMEDHKGRVGPGGAHLNVLQRSQQLQRRELRRGGDRRVEEVWLVRDVGRGRLE